MKEDVCTVGMYIKVCTFWDSPPEPCGGIQVSCCSRNTNSSQRDMIEV